MKKSNTKIGIEYLSICPVCQAGNSDNKLVFSMYDFDFECKFYSCMNCGVIYQNPRLLFENRSALQENSKFYDIDEAALNEEIGKYESIVKIVEQYVSPGIMLEVGCANGFLLAAAKRRGWRAKGIEPCFKTANFAKNKLGLDIICAPVEEASLGNEHFDAVIAWHVLEHLDNPGEVFKKIRSLLNDKGVFAVQVPSFEFMECFRQRNELTALLCRVHVLSFTKKALLYLFQTAGFHVISVSMRQDDMMLTILGGKSNNAN